MTQEQFNEIMQEASKRYQEAKEKHPIFTDSHTRAVTLLTEEVGEVAKAVNDYIDKIEPDWDRSQIRAELFDVMTVCLRYIEFIDDKHKKPPPIKSGGKEIRQEQE